MNIHEFKDPVKKARFLVFMGYPREEVIEVLVEDDWTESEASKLVAMMVQAQEQRDQADGKAIERAQRAVIAEHDLSKSNWEVQ